jgi:mono/diheme cytochrome c family protein
MTRWLKGGAVCAAVLAGLALLAACFAWLYSESVIERHYPLLSMDVPVSDKPGTIARGRHLAKLMGCFGCHGGGLEGRLIRPAGRFEIYAPNLTRSAQVLTDEEFARAIRDGLKPDGKSLWAMPSQVFTYMSVADVAAIVSYVHSLPARGAQTPPPRFSWRDRLAIIKGDLEPTATRVEEAGASLDLGPRYEGGRYIARTTCAACHGLDLTGTPDRSIPDLDIVSRYNLRDFFGLMREGHAPDGRPVPAMQALSRARFSGFKDYEVMALYDYLAARAAALPPR